MITESEYNSQQHKEAEFNRLFDSIIKKSPFGQWYGLMVMASNLVTKNLPKGIAIDKDGKPIVIYIGKPKTMGKKKGKRRKGVVNKLAGVWATATHKSIASDLSGKKYGAALLDVFGGGQIKDMMKQMKYKDIFYIDPKDVRLLWAKKVASVSPVNNILIQSAITKDGERFNKSGKDSENKNTSESEKEIVIKPNTEIKKIKKQNSIKTFLQKLFNNYKQ